MKIQTIKTIVSVAVFIFLLFQAAGALAQDNPAARSRELYQKAMASYNEKDYPSYLGTMLEINGLRSRHPAVIYNLAGAYALTGQEGEALQWLGRLADMGLFANPEEDADFDSIRDTEGFAAVSARFAANAEPVGNSEAVFTVPQKKLIPEGITHDPLTGNFYVSSVYKRGIVEVIPGESHISERVHIPESRTFATWERGDGLWSVFALRVDPNRRVLWACSSAIEQTPRIEKDRIGYAGVFEYDLTTRRLINRYVLSNRRSKHLFGDMTLSRSGSVYISDSLDRAIYRLDGAGGTFDRWLESEQFAFPQGLALSGDERILFLADYLHGVFRIGVDDREVRLLPYPDDMTMLGIDGLAWHDGDLIAIQNGVRPHRVIRLELNEKQDRIEGWEVLEANHPGFDEPTLGVVVREPAGWGTSSVSPGGAAFYYVANSHWGAFDRQGNLRENAELTVPLVLRLPLD